MKRITLCALLVLTICLSGNTQVNPHAIGLRGGLGWGGYGGEISYQHGFGEKNRLELDLGWRSYNHNNGNGNGNNWKYQHLAISGIYHWVWNLTEGLNWFIGPGAQLGFYDDYYDNDSGGGIAIGGQIGLEYDFNQHGLPIQMGLDARPMWNFIGYYSGFGGGSAFSIRYTF